jgi:hypothetical protein
LVLPHLLQVPVLLLLSLLPLLLSILSAISCYASASTAHKPGQYPSNNQGTKHTHDKNHVNLP